MDPSGPPRFSIDKEIQTIRKPARKKLTCGETSGDGNSLNAQ
jgi:hypothetical protein